MLGIRGNASWLHGVNQEVLERRTKRNFYGPWLSREALSLKELWLVNKLGEVMKSRGPLKNNCSSPISWQERVIFHPQNKQKTFGSTISAFPRFPEVNRYVQHVQYSSLLPGNLGNWVFGDSQVKEKRITTPLARLPSGSGVFGGEFKPLNKASPCSVLVLFARTTSKSEWLPIVFVFVLPKEVVILGQFLMTWV